ncbi:ribonuclease III [Swaminathania salitolerans]|uniref:Ribonuclease 3 n=1 Tax=Swaminathania salitolerans TaxID=182838 RepID=A0A511BM59_9PROT|nr:ribonuclease III [Swaminathania salitolerans]GBQ15605.1 ribonuclease III [Swaminathania salitolerans LMG 21291]GEL01420.1 ribonuclease 3 [Swaminathania salitolerans]
MTGDDRVLDALQEALGHRFSDRALLEQALTHRSAVSVRKGRRGSRQAGRTAAGDSPGKGSNERLEFIGDRVLGLIMAEWLLEQFPDEPEGALGPRHASLVSRNALAPIAEEIGVASALRIAEHEEQAGIRGLANVQADAMEALLGAVYLDGGLAPARRFVRARWRGLLTAQITPPKDPKTALQEFVLARGYPLPEYETLSMEGPSHAPRFTISVTGMGHTGEGVAGSKRLAESEAATALLRRLNRGRKGTKERT